MCPARLPDAYRPLRVQPGRTVQSAPMSREERAASRAEARRRARLAARGELAEPEEGQPEPEPPHQPRRGFIGRMFPPAPPLPGRPDPLAGFTGSGPLRPISEGLYLLRKNPFAWILPGIVAVPGYVTSFGGALSLLGTFLLFGALIAAGWFGWQRPALFGVVAALVCFVAATAFVLVAFAQQGVGFDTFSAATLVAQLGSLLYLLALGFLGGWYGGYLRRRQTQLSADTRQRQRRR